MDHLKQKTLKTSRNLEYTYYHSPSPNNAKPTLLMCHGWPDSAHLYATLSSSIADLGFPMLIPDCLGYGGTSKPTDASLYNSKSMTEDVIGILDAEGIDKVIAIGHDWGSFLAQRVCLFYPQRVVSLVMLSVAYRPPAPEGQPFNLDKVLEMSMKNVGYPLYEYWHLFAGPDGPEVLGGHVESLYTVLHGDKQGWMKEMFCTPGRMREYLQADKQVPVKEYAKDEKVKEAWISRMKKDGFGGPQCWYRAMVESHHYEAEKSLRGDKKIIKVPVLFVGCTRDDVGLISNIYPSRDQDLLPDLTIEIIDSGHWVTMEKPKELEEVMRKWLKAF